MVFTKNPTGRHFLKTTHVGMREAVTANILKRNGEGPRIGVACTLVTLSSSTSQESSIIPSGVGADSDDSLLLEPLVSGAQSLYWPPLSSSSSVPFLNRP